MIRSILSKAAWVGRTASMVFGLALVLALVLGVASMAFGANGANFIIGSLKNSASAITKLTGTVGGGPALRVSNPSTATGSTALDLQVASGKAPMKVNSSTKVANLNADKLDGKDSTELATRASEAWHEVGAQGEPAFNSISDPVVGRKPLWQNFGGGHNTVGFYKDPLGVVHLKGIAQVPSSIGLAASCGSTTNHVFILPQGYRPAARDVHPTLRDNTLSRIDVLTTGEVIYCDSREFSSGQWISLDGIEFRAAN